MINKSQILFKLITLRYSHYHCLITLTVPILLHHMRISTINIFSVMNKAKIFENPKPNMKHKELIKP